MSTPYEPFRITKVGSDLQADDNVFNGGGNVFNITPFISRCDPDFADAVNALWTKTEADWPYVHAGSAIPMPLQGRDSPSCAAVVNWLAQRNLGWFPGAALPSDGGEAPAPYSLGLDVTHDDAAGTIPYINPALVKDPEAALILNYCLDHSFDW